jgi:hypothetical protein
MMPRIHFIGDIFCDIIAGGVENLPEWGGDSLAFAGIAIHPGATILFVS